MSRHKKILLVILAWCGFIVLFLVLSTPILSLYAVDGIISYEQVMPAIIASYLLILPLLFLFRASVQILTMATIEVFDDGLHTLRA